MKRSTYKLAIFVMAAAFTASCGNKTAPAETTNDSIQTDTATTVKETPTEDNTVEGNILTAKGLKDIPIGTAFKSLPAKVDGLYTKLEEVSNDDFEGYYLYNNSDDAAIMLEGNGKVETITVMGGDIKTAQGIYVGMPLKELKKAKGIEKIATDPEADYQQEQYKIEGVTISIDSYADKGDIVSQMIAGN